MERLATKPLPKEAVLQQDKPHLPLLLEQMAELDSYLRKGIHRVFEQIGEIETVLTPIIGNISHATLEAKPVKEPIMPESALAEQLLIRSDYIAGHISRIEEIISANNELIKRIQQIV
jgi:hypothetical protein